MEHTIWASFNWDCMFEASFWYAFSEIGLSSQKMWRYGSNPSLGVKLADWKNPNPKHTLLKLHGSISWWMEDGKLTYLPFGAHGKLSAKWRKYERDDEMEDYPVILEPSAYKYRGRVYDLLACQWDILLRGLCEADYIVIVGYSLPDLDSQARSKILTAFQINDTAHWAVVDYAPPNIIRRYERLLR